MSLTTVVPAAPGFEAVCFVWDGENIVDFHYVPIIAWILSVETHENKRCSYIVQAVAPEPQAESSIVRSESGDIIFLNDRSFDESQLQLAIEYAVKRRKAGIK